MIHLIDDSDWCYSIGEAIRNARAHDTIVVTSKMQMMLAEKARRNVCPHKPLTVVVQRAHAA